MTIWSGVRFSLRFSILLFLWALGLYGLWAKVAIQFVLLLYFWCLRVLHDFFFNFWSNIQFVFDNMIKYKKFKWSYNYEAEPNNIISIFKSLLSSICAISKICLVIVDTILPSFSRRNLHQGAQFIVIISASLLVLFVLYDHDGIGILLANLIGITFIELTWFYFVFDNVLRPSLDKEPRPSVKKECPFS